MEKSEIVLSFHGFKDYQECPERYKFKYIDRIKPKELENKKNAFFGTLCADLFDLWVKERQFEKPESTWQQWVVDNAHTLGTVIVSKNFIIWDHEDEYQELLGLAAHCLPKCFIALRDEGFISPGIKSEVNPGRLEIAEGCKITGRIDFIAPKDGAIYIIDGKTSKTRDKYLDSRQLYFYFLMVRNFFGEKVPVKVGYQYIRYGDIDVYEVDPIILNKFLEELKQTFSNIKDQKFAATPSFSNCRFCSFKDECESKKNWEMEKRYRKNKDIYDQFSDSSIINLDF